MSIAALLFLASLGVVILIGFIIYLILSHYRKMIAQQALLSERETKHQKEMLSASMEIAERERANIAANVHDEIGIMLHVFKQNISRMRRNITNVKLIDDLLEETDREINRTIHITRSIANELMPSALGNIGFIESMAYLCDYFNSAGVIRLSFLGEIERLELEKSASVHLYRLVKEVMNNVVKHTKASEAELTLSLREKILNITIMHNGKGISNETVNKLIGSSKGIGLKSIMGRAQLINADVQYVIEENNQAKIIIETPII